MSRSVTMILNFPKMEFSSIFDLFDFLKMQNKKILLVLDEYQYFKESKKDFELDSLMQSIESS